ncbi:MAG TPA: C40 family peptidase [Dermatophilaceae bacterium]|nr:C40 family peptidase [Dermatophilaceae bacterium]
MQSNAFGSLSSSVSRNVQPLLQASAVLVVSTGLAASMALPAQAAPAAPTAPAHISAVALGRTVTLSATRPTLTAAPRMATVRHVSRVTLAKRAVQYRSATAAVRAYRVLRTASKLTGIYYRWGGTSPRGFDCSGFTSYIYRKAGVRLPRTAAAQQRYSSRTRTPRPGDLIFFGSPAHHVAIYAGNGKMYHSPRTGKKSGLYPIYNKNRARYGRVF